MTGFSRPKLGLLLLFSYLATLFIVHNQVHDQAIRGAESQVVRFLYSYRSVRRLVQEWHKPEIYRLQESGQLSRDYFSPLLLSSTLNARGYLGFLNQTLREAGEPGVEFKLATDNPRNPQNQADAREIALLQAIRRGEFTEFKAVEEHDGNASYFYAMATEPTRPECLRCHGDPRSAPQMLLDQYGDQGGFHESVGTIRAVLTMRVPLAPFYQKAKHYLLIIAASLLGVFALLFLAFDYFLRRLEDSKRKIDEQNRALIQLSRHDPLTGALNRLGFQRELEGHLKLAQRHRDPLAVVLLDLDHFKDVNDQHGHAAGDELLGKVARVIDDMLRESDLFGRWGGEEFLLGLPRTSLTEAVALAERVRRTLQQVEVVRGDRRIRTTASFGVAGYHYDEGLEDMVERADQAMYQAKREGRNRVVARIGDANQADIPGAADPLSAPNAGA